jgi:multidrug transporter EmrE-like cation transporter
VLWVVVLRKLPLTIVHPITGIAFVLVPLFSHFVWNEPLPTMRLFGIGIITLGVYFVARGSL